MSQFQKVSPWNLQLAYREGVILLGVARHGVRFRDRVRKLHIKAGDILLELDGVEIHPESFAKIVVRKLPKDNVVLKVLRAGKTMIANVTLGYRTLKK